MNLVDKINPLNVLDCREVDEPSPHFHYVHIDLKYNLVTTMREWIITNLRHRFYLRESLILENGQYQIKLKIGFEEPKEASFFLIACPHLKYSAN